MHKWVISIASMMAFLFSAPAQAQVSYRYTKSGSSFLVYASNSSNRPYNCSATVTANYVDYGQPKTAQSQANYGVPANSAERLVWQWQTTWAASTLDFNYQHAGCS